MQIIETKLPTNGSFKRRNSTDEIILHHAEASRASVEEVNRWHLERGWTGIGYHFYIRRDGQILTTRPVERAAPTPTATMPLYRNRLTKADWTTMGIPKTHARNGNATRSAYWSALC